MSEYSESKKRANRKWDKENLWRFSIALPKKDKERIQNAAKARGLSVAGYIKELVAKDLQDLV